MKGMIARVADSCFWLGRYLERAESSARMLFVTRNLSLDTHIAPHDLWLPVIIVAGEEVPFTERYGVDRAAEGELVQRYLTWDEDALVSLARSVGAARWNARCVREVVSLEVWETINELHVWLATAEARELFETGRYDFYRRIKRDVQLVVGQLRGTMLHDEALEFIWLGLLLERVGQTARTLDVHHHALSQMAAREPDPGVGTVLWLSLLRACSAFEPFTKRRRGEPSGEAVAAFLLLERDFPRSVRYGVRQAYRRLSRIRPPEADELPGGQTLEQMRALDAWLDEMTPDLLAGGGLHAALTHVVEETAAICSGLGRELLGHGA